MQHLLSKPTLRTSDLLYNFLTQPDEFTLPNGEIILCTYYSLDLPRIRDEPYLRLAKMFKVVPRRLRIEVRLLFSLST